MNRFEERADVKRIERVIDHFRAYQYGEPYEGAPVMMRHSFDITDQDAEMILLALDVLKDLRETQTSVEASVNAWTRERMYEKAFQKIRNGFKS